MRKISLELKSQSVAFVSQNFHDFIFSIESDLIKGFKLYAFYFKLIFYNNFSKKYGYFVLSERINVDLILVR